MPTALEYMALAGGVVCQKDVAGTEAPLRAIADFDLTLTGQVDHVLPSRRPMPVMEVAGRSVTENDALPGLELFDVHLDLFELVKLLVRSGVDSHDFHDFAFIEKRAVKNNLMHSLTSLPRLDTIAAVESMSNDRVPPHIQTLKLGAQAVGALAVGALALGALAIGALVIGRLVIGRHTNPTT